VDRDGVPMGVHIIEVPKHKNQSAQAVETFARWARRHIGGLGGLLPRAMAVEGQSIRRGGHARPNDIKNLAFAAGGISASLLDRWPKADLFVPEPSEWKGSIPKEVHQQRICSAVGWPHERRKGYCVPEDIGDCESVRWSDREERKAMRGGDWKHGLDALGLALWARDQWEKNR
jgi:hypothetical protein